jgi:hypothetical protein
MNCDVALDRMLEAEPAELRAETRSGLSRHLGECQRCAAVAATLLAELDRLDDDLDAWARSADANAAVDAVLAAERPLDRRSAWARHAWIPLAAAALIAGLLLVTPNGPDRGTVAQRPRIQPEVTVRPPSDRGAVVMKTSNPKITIVWLYEREET